MQNANTLLASKNIRADMPALAITVEEALANILEYVDDAGIELDLEQMTRSELFTLFSSYGECVVSYHPESYHQVRATFIRNFEMLEKYGLTTSDLEVLDF